ncbi:hypothetical protein GGX14DRAFT_389201 [Mycena pura]|uniref:Uncharacterized protein n=1 Tax=Mycena pura TaxID=153505 RepID=A0AAD6VUU4_9AGAR|nr:hypothetical protein GGX14DRAFT_389201 [Mycena pura]
MGTSSGRQYGDVQTIAMVLDGLDIQPPTDARPPIASFAEADRNGVVRSWLNGGNKIPAAAERASPLRIQIGGRVDRRSGRSDNVDDEVEVGEVEFLRGPGSHLDRLRQRHYISADGSLSAPAPRAVLDAHQLSSAGGSRARARHTMHVNIGARRTPRTDRCLCPLPTTHPSPPPNCPPIASELARATHAAGHLPSTPRQCFSGCLFDVVQPRNVEAVLSLLWDRNCGRSSRRRVFVPERVMHGPLRSLWRLWWPSFVAQTPSSSKTLLVARHIRHIHATHSAPRPLTKTPRNSETSKLRHIAPGHTPACPSFAARCLPLTAAHRLTLPPYLRLLPLVPPTRRQPPPPPASCRALPAPATGLSKSCSERLRAQRARLRHSQRIAYTAAERTRSTHDSLHFRTPFPAPNCPPFLSAVLTSCARATHATGVNSQAHSPASVLTATDLWLREQSRSYADSLVPPTAPARPHAHSSLHRHIKYRRRFDGAVLYSAFIILPTARDSLAVPSASYHRSLPAAHVPRRVQDTLLTFGGRTRAQRRRVRWDGDHGRRSSVRLVSGSGGQRAASVAAGHASGSGCGSRRAVRGAQLILGELRSGRHEPRGRSAILPAPVVEHPAAPARAHGIARRLAHRRCAGIRALAHQLGARGACRTPADTVLALHYVAHVFPDALRNAAQLCRKREQGANVLYVYLVDGRLSVKSRGLHNLISYFTMPSNTAIELNVGNITSLSPGDTFSIKTDFTSASAPSVQLSFLPPAALSPSAQERTSHKRTSKIKRPRKVTKRAKTSTGGNPDAITSDFSETEVSESDELFYATRSVEDPSRPVRIIRRVVHDLPIIISPRSKKQAIPANVPRPHPDAKPVFIRPANADRALAVAAASVSYVEEAKRVVGKVKTE